MRKKNIYRWMLLSILLTLGFYGGMRFDTDFYRWAGKSDPTNQLGQVAVNTFTEAPKADEPKESTSGNLRLIFGGDVMFDSTVKVRMQEEGSARVFEGIKQHFLDADLSMVNLETAISERGMPEKKQFRFRASPQTAALLKQSGIDVVTLANNHVLDYGRDALQDSFSFLDAQDIAYVGAGNTKMEAQKPVFIEKKGFKIAVLGASRVIPSVDWYATTERSGVFGCYDPAELYAQIKSAKTMADLVVVYVHWGNEKETKPLRYQKDIAHASIEFGADIVVGAHPHVLQGIEHYQQGVIAYSLGNLVFTDLKKETMLLQVDVVDKKVKQSTVIPLEIQRYFPMPYPEGEAKASFYKRLSEISFDVRIDAASGIVYSQ